MPDHHTLDIKRVAILFAGGPAPGGQRRDLDCSVFIS